VETGGILDAKLRFHWEIREYGLRKRKRHVSREIASGAATAV